MKRWLAVTLPLAMVSFISGAAAAESRPTGPHGSGEHAPRAAEPTSGGTLHWPLWQEVSRGWDPTQLNGTPDAAQIQAVYDSLLTIDPATGDVGPGIAESLTSEDSVHWTLELRPNVTFSDGTAYDAEAVRFNWERLADPDFQAIQASAASAIESMSVIDTLTLEITLAEPNGQFPRTVATRMYWIASPTALASVDPGTPWTSPVGAGPFIVESWRLDAETVLVRNPAYWQDGLPLLDGVVFSQIPDDAQRLNTVISGEAHGTNLGAYGFGFVAQADAAGLMTEVNFKSPVGGNIFQYNMTQPPFNDPVARRAVWHAVDLQGLNETVFFGLNELAYPDVISPAHPLHTPGDHVAQYDPQLAQQLFDEYEAAHGEPLRFAILNNPQQSPMNEYLLASLSTFNHVEVSLEDITAADNTPRQLAHQFDMGQYGVLGSDPEPDFYEIFHSGESRNGSGYSNPIYDRMVELGRTSLDAAERREAYAAALAQLAADVPGFFTFRQVDLYAFDDSIRGLSFSAIGRTPNLAELWLES